MNDRRLVDAHILNRRCVGPSSTVSSGAAHLAVSKQTVSGPIMRPPPACFPLTCKCERFLLALLMTVDIFAINSQSHFLKMAEGKHQVPKHPHHAALKEVTFTCGSHSLAKDCGRRFSRQHGHKIKNHLPNPRLGERTRTGTQMRQRHATPTDRQKPTLWG